MLSDNEFRILLDRLNRPWTGYRKVRKGVKKRLRRHMLALGVTAISPYLDRLARDPKAKAACESCLRVTISRFFRDRQLWQSLRSHILPDLVERFPPPIRIWSAGCASGEEPYSLAITWNELGPPSQIDLLATDADEICLERARAGIYSRSSLKEVPHEIRKKYFDPRQGERRFLIRSHRLPPIRWLHHDLLDPAPENSPFHMILLRNNLLTYYQGPHQHDAFAHMVSRLIPAGRLVTGAHERLPESGAALIQDDHCPWVFRLE